MAPKTNNIMSLSLLLIIFLLSLFFFINGDVLGSNFYKLNPFSSPLFIMFLLYIVINLFLSVHFLLVLRYKGEYTPGQKVSVGINICSMILIFIMIVLLALLCRIDQGDNGSDCRLSIQIVGFVGSIGFLFVHILSFVLFFSGTKKIENLNKL